MKSKISKLYHNTLGRFVECVGLFRIDIETFNYKFDLGKESRYTFLIPNIEDIELLFQHVNNTKKKEIVRDRFKRGNYLCFAYLDTDSNRLVYSRWVCTGSYYSEPFRKRLTFKSNECFTLDSYTNPNYRGLGLHRKMNVEMLQWLKKSTDYRYVYMVIKCFIPHLHKVVKDLGYKKIETKIYYKQGSLKQFFKLVANKFSK